MTNAGGGDIAVANTGGALAIADVGELGYGIEQTASGNIFIASDNQIAVNGAIQILGPAGNIGLHAANGIALSALLSVPSANGTVALESDAGDIIQTASISAAAVSGVAPRDSISVAAVSGVAPQGSISAAAVSAVAPQGSVQLTGPANAVGTIAGTANGSQGFALTDGSGVTVGTVPSVGGQAAVTGITSSANAVTLQTGNGGDITIASAVNAGNGQVILTASGAVQQGTGGVISAGSLSMTAGAARHRQRCGAAPHPGRHAGKRHVARAGVSEQCQRHHDRCHRGNGHRQRQRRGFRVHAQSTGLRLQRQHHGCRGDADGRRGDGSRGRLVGVGDHGDCSVCRLRSRDRDVSPAGRDTHSRGNPLGPEHRSLCRRCDRCDRHDDGGCHADALPRVPTDSDADSRVVVHVRRQ